MATSPTTMVARPSMICQESGPGPSASVIGIIRTNIHDQPSKPSIPDIYDIPKASKPEKAPAMVAPP